MYTKSIFFILYCFFISTASFARTFLLLDDFNAAVSANKLGGATGGWNYNPGDKEQYCEASFDNKVFRGGEGASLRLKYDIDTPVTYYKEFPNTSFNGYYTKLNNADLTGLKYLVMYIKGGHDQGFTRNITVEIKNARQSEKYVLEGITDSWKRFIVPLWQFKNISDWSAMQEMVITFDDKATRKTGVIYVDDICFTAQAQPPSLGAKRVASNKKIIIDGLLDEWENAKGVMKFSEKNIETGTINGRNDCDAISSFAWDDEYLYFAAKVNDDQLLCREDGSNIWKEDCIELYIDPQNDGFIWKNKKDFQFGFAPTGKDDKPHGWAWFQKKEFNSIGLLGSSSNSAGSPATYQIEAAIPWKFFGIIPEKGSSIGISVALHDLDDKEDVGAKLNWFYLPEGNNVLLGKLVLQ